MSIRLFIADTDESHIQSVSRCVANCPDIRVIGSSGNGSHTLRQLAITPADILISEVQLPGLDGLMLLREVQTLHHSPSVIICTHFYSSACVSKACSLGASFFMYKPLDYSRLPKIIRDYHRSRLQGVTNARIAPTAKRLSKAQRIGEMLRNLGMPANLTGSMYLSEALHLASEDPTLVKNLSKGLYAEVAARTMSTPARLERSIRNAISVACDRGGLEQRFGHCPTNREFLLYLLEQLRYDPEA